MEARVVGVNHDQGVGAAGAAVDDMGDGMQCSNHPYRNNPGGICAFCLQEKLGKLVSSSFPLPIRGSSSSSSSPPSFRSDNIGGAGVASGNGGGLVTGSVAAASLSLSLSARPTSTSSSTTRSRNVSNGIANDQFYYTTRRARIPFLLAKKKKKIMVGPSATSDRAADIVFKRSKSTTTPRRGHGHFLDDTNNEDFSPRKRGFWSFLYHSSSSSKNKVDHKITTLATPNVGSSHLRPSLSKKSATNIVIEEDDDDDDEDGSPNSASQATASSFERKVSRSRSVGCGSRSFSGDFFERISTGFGDCTLRRVESQREGKPKVHNAASSSHHHHHMKERVKCGGIFGGFIMTSSSSSSSSSSYWVSSSSTDHQDNVNGKSSSSLAHGRSRSWGWAFASPMRAFGSKPSSKDGSKKRDHVIRESANKNTTPNLAAIPSLLAVRG